jgi:hypothetical protein
MGQKVNPAAFPYFGSAAAILCAKEARTAKYPAERVSQPPIVFAIGRQAPVIQDLSGTLELEERGFWSAPLPLPGRAKSGDAAQTARRSWAPDDLQEEPTIHSPVRQCTCGQTPNGRRANDERSIAEGKLLCSGIAFLPNAYYRFHSMLPPRRQSRFEEAILKQLTSQSSRMCHNSQSRTKTTVYQKVVVRIVFTKRRTGRRNGLIRV